MVLTAVDKETATTRRPTAVDQTEVMAQEERHVHLRLLWLLQVPDFPRVLPRQATSQQSELQERLSVRSDQRRPLCPGRTSQDHHMHLLAILMRLLHIALPLLAQELPPLHHLPFR